MGHFFAGWIHFTSSQSKFAVCSSSLYGEQLLAPYPALKVEGHFLLGINLFFRYSSFLETISSVHSLRMLHAMVTKVRLSWKTWINSHAPPIVFMLWAEVLHEHSLSETVWYVICVLLLWRRHCDSIMNGILIVVDQLPRHSFEEWSRLTNTLHGTRHNRKLFWKYKLKLCSFMLQIQTVRSYPCLWKGSVLWCL